MTGEYVVVLITTPAGKGEDIANFIVERRLSACVNIIKEIRSFYWWKGNIERDNEELLIIKTKRQVLDKLIEEVKKVHPYTVPEIIALPIVAGNIDYLNWIEEEVKQ